MSEPTLIQKQALARAVLLRLRLTELRDHARAARAVGKMGLIAHLDEDDRQLDLLISEIRQIIGGISE